MLKVNLDRNNDILYIALSDMSNSYGEEENGNLIFYDLITNQVTGVTIFDFLEKYNNNRIQIEVLPMKIDFANDIYPYLNIDIEH